jgi:hypothetical protein
MVRDASSELKTVLVALLFIKWQEAAPLAQSDQPTIVAAVLMPLVR